MSRINTNVSAMIARNNLQQTNGDLNVRLERLSTGLRINRGADDPAGLIVSERLRSEIKGIDQSIDNAERAVNVIATAEAALAEVSDLLTSIKSLVVEAANEGGFTDDEVRANQLQIDSAISSITRISNTTSFAGLKLLNGSLDYVISGVNPTAIEDVRVTGAQIGQEPYLPVNVEVIRSAKTAQLFLSGGLSSVAYPGGGQLLSSVSFEVSGPDGVEAFTFTSGTNLSAVVFAVNQASQATGVSASLVSATDPTSGVVFTSTSTGSDSLVSVVELDQSSSFETFDQKNGGPQTRDVGEDVLALVNGNLALGDGEKISLNSNTLNIEMTLSKSAAQTLGSHEFSITGGGAMYQVGGNVNFQQQVNIGIQSVAATRLGNNQVGFLNSVVSGGANSLVAGQMAEADQIINAAIDQVATLRGRLGAFERNTLQTTLRSQQIALENLTASESRIRDADFAEETSALTRAQILQNAGTSTLALANSSAQSVLSLLGG